MSRQFSDRYIVWRFLQLQHLLIDELRLLVHDKVGIERALVAVDGLVLLPAYSGKCDSGKSRCDGQIFLVCAVAALDM